MQKRGAVGAFEAPLGNAVRTFSRAFPRRAFRPVFARRLGADMPRPKRTHKVTPLGGGLFRVLTTVTLEQVLTEEQLLRRGIQPPGPDVPWKQEQPRDEGMRRRGQGTPFGQVMTYWREQLHGYDARLPQLIPQLLDQFPLETILSAIDQVKAQKSHLPKYDRFKRVFQELRAREGESDELT